MPITTSDPGPPAHESLEWDLSEILSKTELFLGPLTRGDFVKTRYHVPTTALESTHAKQAQLQEAFARLQSRLLKLLLTQRKDARLIPELERNDYKGIITAYNGLVDRLSGYQLIYDDESLLGSLSPGDSILDHATIQPIEITPFDFVTGFAFQCKSSYGDGLFVYWNPISYEIVWRKERKSAIGVRGVNQDGSPIFDHRFRRGVASALNESTGAWVFEVGYSDTPYAAAYNPATQTVETKTSGKEVGIAGVYDPLEGKVTWKTARESGVAGYFDPEKKSVVWVTERRAGVACIWRDVDGGYHTSSGSFGGDVF